MKNDLEAAFDRVILDSYEKVKFECGYSGTRFFQMFREYGGVETAKRLLQTPDHQDGLTRLWELRRLDLSIEALVLKEQWSPLFTDDELNVARARLERLGYRV